MRGFEANRRHHAGFKRPFPGFHANTPAVASLKAREAEFGTRRDQVITDGSLVAQELVIHNHADRMLTVIVRTGVALTVTIETCNGIGTTSLKDGSQNVFNHTMSGYRGGNRVRLRARRLPRAHSWNAALSSFVEVGQVMLNPKLRAMLFDKSPDHVASSPGAEKNRDILAAYRFAQEGDFR